MNRSVLGVALLAVVLAGMSFAAQVEPQLATTLNSAAPDAKFPVEFFMKAQANAAQLDASLDLLPRPQRRARVREVLEQHCAGTQRDLLNYLNGLDNTQVEDVRSLWLVNLVSCWATKEVIYAVAARPDVELVLYGKVAVELGEINLKAAVAEADAIEPNLVTTNARGAWKQGCHGEDVVIGVVDTGVRYTHHDLRDHLWTSTEYPNCGFNFASNQYSSGHPGPSTYDTLTPMDYYGHGTHCAGITSADGAYGNGTRDTMGVAPAAKIMALPVDVYLHTPYPDTSMENNTLAGMQFAVSPTRDPTNGADIITMSLGLISSWLPRRAVWRAAEVNVMNAGLVHVVAAGNEGSGARTIRTSGDCPPPWPNPANHPSDNATSAVITIGATDNSDQIASFSSRGPSDWGSIAPYNDYAYPPGLIDPDVCMPGVNILSTYNSGDQAYTTMSGTSMATPGAAGVVALMFSKNPNLTPRMVDSILECHAVTDLGPSGKENTFGAGRLNCSLAVAFTPLPGPSHDVGIGPILVPAERVDPAVALTPAVIISNPGTYNETNIPVTFNIESLGTVIYTQNATLPNLDSAGMDTVTFPNWTPGQGGLTYEITACHGYSPDTNRANDTIRRTTVVRGHGLATTGMNIGGRVRAGQSMSPAITLRAADYTETGILCWCWIDSAGTRVYDFSTTVDSVPAGGTAQGTFPAWDIGPAGTQYTVTMFHTFPDANPGDDTLMRTTEASSQMRVLVAYSDAGGTPDLLTAGLTALGDSVDLFNAGSATPTLTQLQPYDGVITFTNNQYLSASAMGDVLADFADLNRAVVIGTFAFTTGWHIQGRITTGGYATLVNGSNSQSAGTLGWFNDAHPIMQGVTEVTDIYRSSVAWASGSDSVAKWNDGKPYVSTSPNMRVVGINNYPGYYNPSRHTGDDWIRVYHQALLWASGGGTGIEDKPPFSLNRDFVLALARPNPVNEQAVINYNLPRTTDVSLEVYDLSGKLVRTLASGTEKAGWHRVTWNRTDNAGSRIPSGVYFYTLKSGTYQSTRKLVVN